MTWLSILFERWLIGDDVGAQITERLRFFLVEEIRKASGIHLVCSRRMVLLVEIVKELTRAL